MPENVYRCPECGANLKLANPVAPGKKLKCPKCQTIFAPTAESAAPPKAAAPKPAAKAAAPKPLAAPKPKPVVDDEEDGAYAVIREPEPPPKEEEEEEDEAPAKGKKKGAKGKKKKETEAEVKQRAPRSKRGPAASELQAPSNALLSASAVSCVCAVVSFMVVLWPIVFSDKPVENWEERLLWIGAIVTAFLYNGVVALGAVKMQNLESYVWAMIAAVGIMLPFNWVLSAATFKWFMGLVSELAGPEFNYITMGVVSLWYVFVGVRNVILLQKADIKEAFAEKPVNY
jgi:hypothetical protein